jgi:hypothetical protein
MVTMTQRHSDPRVQRLLEKLDGLYEELKSDEHYEMTESVAYGHHDPFDIPTCICDACGEQPTMEMARSEPPRWSMVCRCGRKPPSVRKSQWQAMLEWNGINLASFDYRDLPLFGLSNLDAETGHKRLAGFRRNLELRYNIATLEGDIARMTQRSLGIEQPGKGYTRRLQAYLMWCLWGLRLTKLAKQKTKNES